MAFSGRFVDTRWRAHARWRTRGKSEIPPGVENLTVLNTMNSAFDNFLRDYNALKEDRNRIIATAIRATAITLSQRRGQR
jgi:urate oxidase